MSDHELPLAGRALDAACREREALRAERDALREQLAKLYPTLEALRLSLEMEILPGIRAAAQVWEAQRAERAVRLLIAALTPAPALAAQEADQ